MNARMAQARRNHGFSLLEVVIAIAVFAVGILAFAQLQTNLSRSALDAKVRTMAANVGEEQIETQRRFKRLATDPVGSEFAYDDIVNRTRIVNRGGFNFTVTQTVTDYYWDAGTGSFVTTAPAGQPHSDFKRLTLDVAWENPLELQIDDTQSTSDGLGSGSIVLHGIVSSVPTAANRLALIDDINGDTYMPGIDYTPGQLPEVVTLSLGSNRFKESTTPLPDVIRAEELVETEFDVVTFSQSGDNAQFLRREEFRVVSCECTLRAPPASTTHAGRRPTLWNGNDYTEGERVIKPYGEPANNQQSPLCDLCCRDHHDGGTGTADIATDPGRAKYDPFRASTDYHASGTFAGDHNHYKRANDGSLTLADTAGDVYVEACRMVRKDGFFRVAQDLRQEGLNAFPQSFLDQASEETQYSAYVTGAITDLEAAIGATDGYELSAPALTPPLAMVPPVTFPAATVSNPTSLPTATGATTQQLRSRGIYMDYLSDELRAIVNCLQLGGSGADCGAPKVSTALEVLPFFDVQVTWLSRWNESPTNNPVDVSNEAVETNNAHSRGLANRTSGTGISVVSSEVHRGNLGLTATDPIDPAYPSGLRSSQLFVSAVSSTPPPTLGSLVVQGDITSAVGGVKAADVEIAANDAQCDRTNTGYSCIVEALATNPRLTVSNYYKRNRVLVACSTVLATQVVNTGANPYTTFNLPASGTSPVVAHIVIKENACS